MFLLRPASGAGIEFTFTNFASSAPPGSGQADGRILVATWNIASLGAQQREDDHCLIFEVLSWFDIAAIHEVRDNFAHLEDVVRHMAQGTVQELFVLFGT